jgi:multidrug resistance efflux pump
LSLEFVRRAPLQSRRTIAGRLDYDQERHVAIKAACDGIITEIMVQPGDDVVVGQTVAVVSSPAVGAARSAVKMRLADFNLAAAEKQWRETICQGVERLVEMIRAGRTPEEISRTLEGNSLGEFREKLISAYARARLGKRVVDNSRDAAQRGAIAVSVQQQRESELLSSAATLESVLDQSLFEVQQQCNAAKAALAQAERQVEISLQELNTLLGPLAAPLTREQVQNADGQLLSNVNLISPIDGSVEERNLSVGERVSAGEAVFVVGQRIATMGGGRCSRKRLGGDCCRRGTACRD